MLDQGDTETVEEHLNRINQAALQALKEMRLMIYELRPATLLDEGLVVALEHQLDAVERRTGVDVIFQVRGNPDLDNDTQMALFRISEEALNNTLKHARAASVEVKLECDRKRFCLQIIDDGCGFDPELQDQRGGMGLSNMQARADGLGARLEMKSAPGEGTRITVMMDMDP